MADSKSRETGSINSFERRVVTPAFLKGFHHIVIRLLWLTTSLVIHYVNETSRLVLKEPDTLGVVKVLGGRNEVRNALGIVFVNV